MLEISGSYGESGGQLLRSALSLSLLLKRPFFIKDIRSKRTKPGLQRQHLTCVKASAEICSANTEGAQLDSSWLKFEPGEIKGGKLKFDIGSAGSTSLLLQCLLPALVFGKEKTNLELIGGTANPLAPSFLYLKHVFLPTISKIGFAGEMDIKKWGWYPKGGGILEASVTPTKNLLPISLRDRGRLMSIKGFVTLSNLPEHIAEREKTQILKDLIDINVGKKVEVIAAPSIGQGTEVFLCSQYENSVAGFSSLGERGKPAEKVASEACKEFLEFHGSNAAIDHHLGDQLLLYASLAHGTSSFVTSKITPHLFTNAWLIKQFIPEVKIEIGGEEGSLGEVSIQGIKFINKYLR